MRNGKEVTFLIIMIFVVLISTAKAEVGLLPIETIKKAGPVVFGQNASNYESGIFRKKELRISGDSKFKIWVDTPSALSDISDDYGLVVTVSKSF